MTGWGVEAMEDPGPCSVGQPQRAAERQLISLAWTDQAIRTVVCAEARPLTSVSV
jgi:hypothetical protein